MPNIEHFDRIVVGPMDAWFSMDGWRYMTTDDADEDRVKLNHHAAYGDMAIDIRGSSYRELSRAQFRRMLRRALGARGATRPLPAPARTASKASHSRTDAFAGRSAATARLAADDHGGVDIDVLLIIIALMFAFVLIAMLAAVDPLGIVWANQNCIETGC